MAEVRTLKLDFVVKKWQNQYIIFGILIYALCRFQNHKNPVGHIETLTFGFKFWLDNFSFRLPHVLFLVQNVL